MRNEKGQFTKGTSGNPSGRPSGVKDVRPLRSALQSLSLEKPTKELAEPLEKELGVKIESYLDLVAATVLSKSLRGNFQHTKLYFEYLAGRPDKESYPLSVFEGFGEADFSKLLGL